MRHVRFVAINASFADVKAYEIFQVGSKEKGSCARIKNASQKSAFVKNITHDLHRCNENNDWCEFHCQCALIGATKGLVVVMPSTCWLTFREKDRSAERETQRTCSVTSSTFRKCRTDVGGTTALTADLHFLQLSTSFVTHHDNNDGSLPLSSSQANHKQS